jgi:hypothetical protein
MPTQLDASACVSDNGAIPAVAVLYRLSTASNSFISVSMPGAMAASFSVKIMDELSRIKMNSYGYRGIQGVKSIRLDTLDQCTEKCYDRITRFSRHLGADNKKPK